MYSSQHMLKYQKIFVDTTFVYNNDVAYIFTILNGSTLLKGIMLSML